MKSLIEDVAKAVGIVAATIIILALTFGVSWGVVCFLVWLITLCFGLEFNLFYGTGVWLCMILIRIIFMVGSKKK